MSKSARICENNRIILCLDCVHVSQTGENLIQMAHIVETKDPAILLGGAPFAASDLAQAGRHSKVYIAADGGANQALAYGITPQTVIGDMDSITHENKGLIPPDQFHHIAEQDSTDFEKCLTRIKAPVIIGLGFLGARMDHQMAVANALVRFAHQRCVLLGPEGVMFLLPPYIRLDLPEGTVVSLFPMMPVMGTSEGLKWPIDGINFAPHGRIGTSNQALGPVEITCDEPGLLIMLPAQQFETSLRAFTDAPNHWP